MNNFLLTIIVPIYNGEKYIKGIVENIFTVNAAILNKIELLFVDDGSTDKSYLLLAEVQNKHDNVFCYKKENGGIASAREFGLKHCKSKYFTFLDQDDYVVNSYQPFLELIESNHADFLMSNFYRKQNGILQKANNFEKTEIVLKDKLQELLIGFISPKLLNKSESYIGLYPTVWNCIFSTNCFLQNNCHFIRFVHYEDDWLFIVQFLKESSKLILSDEAYYCWNINENSESHTVRYVPHLYEKKKELLNWIMNVLVQLKISKQKVTLYKENFEAHIVVESFLNYSCFLPYKKYKREIEKISEVNTAFWKFDMGGAIS